MAAARSLRTWIAIVPYSIRIVLTHNGISSSIDNGSNAFEHIFDRVCDETVSNTGSPR